MNQQCTPIHGKTFGYWLLFLAVTCSSIASAYGFPVELRKYLQEFLPIVSKHLLPVLSLELPTELTTEEDLHKSYNSRKLFLTCSLYRLFHRGPLIPDTELKYAVDATQTALDFIHGKELSLEELVVLRIALSGSLIALGHRNTALLPKGNRLNWIIIKLQRVEHFNQNPRVEYNSISNMIEHIETYPDVIDRSSSSPSKI